jgi:RIO-like serine/threonine protein kinase
VSFTDRGDGAESFVDADYLLGCDGANSLVRNVIGRFLVRREARALVGLAGRPTTPQAPFRVDAHALAYRYLEGLNLRDARATPGPGFFPDLERTVRDMHATGRLVHLDLRNAGNILVTQDGAPVLLDFQSHLGTRWMPGPLRRFVERIDLAAVYKHWANRSPATMGPERTAALERMNRLRPLWALRGYIGTPRGDRTRT